MPVKKTSSKVSATTGSDSGLTCSSEVRFLGTKYSQIIGVDEAGRGPLAGPVVAAACSILNGAQISGVVDSKKTTEAEREAVYNDLVNNKNVVWAVSIIDHQEIDRINILEASLKAMRESTNAVLAKLRLSQKASKTMLALVDGNKIPADMQVDTQFVIKGDSIVYSIAAASIIAKVTRDRIMHQLDKEYPQYNFAQHKGYPTFEHRTLLMRHGPCNVHRLSYGPVRLAAEAMSARSAGPHKNTKTEKGEHAKSSVASSGKKEERKEVGKGKDGGKGKGGAGAKSNYVGVNKPGSQVETKKTAKTTSMSKKGNKAKKAVITAVKHKRVAKLSATIAPTADEGLRRSTRTRLASSSV